jgi:hypothetical protein
MVPWNVVRIQLRRWVKKARLSDPLLGLVMTGLFAVGAAAQTGQIAGRVTSGESSSPVAEVQVYLATANLGALSRADGRFVILNVPAGTYDLRTQRIGFASTSESVTVTAGATLQVDISLTAQALGLDEIVVTGTAGASRRREVGNAITQINVTDLPERPVSVSNLLQASAPGIEVTAGGGEAGMGKTIRLRGIKSISQTNQPIIYIDGIRMMQGSQPTTRVTTQPIRIQFTRGM